MAATCETILRSGAVCDLQAVQRCDRCEIAACVDHYELWRGETCYDCMVVARRAAYEANRPTVELATERARVKREAYEQTLSPTTGIAAKARELKRSRAVPLCRRHLRSGWNGAKWELRESGICWPLGLINFWCDEYNESPGVAPIISRSSGDFAGAVTSEGQVVRVEHTRRWGKRALVVSHPHEATPAGLITALERINELIT